MSAASKSTDGDTQAIQVFVRIRPFIEQEQQISCIETSTSKDVVIKVSYQKKFTFDEVFGPKSKQTNIYDAVGKPYISEVISGYNCTIITYGPASSGKTYTMNGIIPNITLSNSSGTLNVDNIVDNDSLVEECGLIPRVISELFAELDLLTQPYTMWCTYFELYNEELHDLFSISNESDQIKLYDDRRNKGSIIIQGIEKVIVKNKFEVFKLLKKAQQKKQAVATLKNEKFGCSHTIFTIYVRIQETDTNTDEFIKMGNLSFVDLAGSENVNKFIGSTERRPRDSGRVSQSILTLGRVIKALSEKNSHVPFRESKLTRILQDSLGGKTKTSIIANIAPGIPSFDETVATLEFAQRARTIINKPEINRKISQKILIAQYVDEVTRLRKDLHATRTTSGVWLDTKNYEKLLNESQMQKDEIAQHKASIHALGNKLNETNHKIEMINLNVQDACLDIDAYESDNTQKISENKESIALLKTQQTKVCNKVPHIITSIKDNVDIESNLFENIFKQDKTNAESLQQATNSRCEEFYENLSSLKSWDNLTFEIPSSEDEEDSEDELVNICNETNNFMATFKDVYSNMESTLMDRSKSDNILKILNSSCCKSSQLLDTVANVKQNLRQSILSRIETVNAKLMETKKEQLNGISKCQDLRNNVKGIITNCIEETEKNDRCNLNTLKTGTNLIGEILVTEDSCNNYLMEYKTQASQKNKFLQEQLAKIPETINTGSEELLTKNSNMHQEQKRALSETLEDTYKSIMKKDQQDEVFSQITKSFHQDSEQHNLIMVDNIHQLESMVKCTDTNITEVKHAGDTPTRTHYKYPPGFKDLTPKEKVLSRFRERHNLTGNAENTEGCTTPNRVMSDDVGN